MEHNDENSGHGSSLVGAIFMSNRTTKKECLRRKLFGLPSSQASFVKKIKAGMILFLFEHEERKLYGVYEATSDGAMNIFPNAYSSSGFHFPAQVQFKVIWYCKPLSEDEFGDAIKENYYMAHKFHFGLSYEQVLKLIQLFNSRKTNLQNYQIPGPRQKIPKTFERSGSVKSRLTEMDRSLQFDMIEVNADHDLDSRYPGSSVLNTNSSMYYKNIKQTMEGNMIHQPLETESNMMRSTSQFIRPLRESDRALRGSFPASPPSSRRYFNTDPRLEVEQPSIALGTNDPSLAQKLTAASRYSVYDQAPYFRSQSYSSQSDPTIQLPPPNYSNLDVSSSLEGLPVPPYDPSRPSIPFVGTEGYSNFHDPSKPSCPDCHDSSTSRIYSPTVGMSVSKETEHLTAMPRLNFCYDSPEASQLQDCSRGVRYWHQRPPSDYIPLSEDRNLVMSKESSHFLRCPQGLMGVHPSESQDENDFERMGVAYHFEHSSESHPTTTNASLYSDTSTRASVFSRLSMAPTIRRLKDEACVPDTTPALDQLVELVTQRRNQWHKMTKLPQNFIPQGNEQLETVSEMELDGADSFIKLEPDTEEMAEESFEPPCFNFKRRSEVQKVNVRTETGGYAEGGKEKQKRRKLLRPSFSDNDDFMEADKECQNAHASLQDIDGVQTSVKVGNGKRSAEISDSSVKCEDDHGDRGGSSSLEASLGNAEVINRKGNVDGPKDCGGIWTAKKLFQEPDISQSSVIHVEGTGTVESLTFSPSGVADERVVSVEEDGTSLVSIDLPEAPNLQGSRKTKLVSRDDATTCQAVDECLGNKCVGTDEKEMIMSNANAGIDFKDMIMSDGNADMCLLLSVKEATAGDLKETGMLVETSHLVDDRDTALHVCDSGKAMYSEGNDGKKVIIDAGDKEISLLDSNINRAHVLTAFTGSGGKEEHTFYTDSSSVSIMSADIRCEGKEVRDEQNRIDEKDKLMSDGNGEPRSLEICIDCSNASSGNLKSEEKSGEKVHAIVEEILASPFRRRPEGKKSNEKLKKVSLHSHLEDVLTNQL